MCLFLFLLYVMSYILGNLRLLVTFCLCFDLFQDYFCEELKFYLSLFPYLSF